MWLVLDLVYLLAALLALPILLWQRIARGKKRGGWAERFGRLPPRRTTRPSVWIHAVSLGETNATRGIVDALRRRLPDHDVAISTTTDTGYARAREIYPDLYVFRYPLDFSWVVRRALRTINPSVIVLMELEVWPNLVMLAAARGIPVAVANGRITEDRSMRRFRMPIVRQFAGLMFRRLAWVGAQNDSYADRFRELGVPTGRVQVAGMLKWDTAQVVDDLPGTAALRTACGIDNARPLWVCGQTGDGEEEIVLGAYRRLRETMPTLQLAIIPRKPERFDDVAAQISRHAFRLERRSIRRDGTAPPTAAPDVVLGDTMGELRKFYCLANAVFVGRSLLPMGGSDVIEVAAIGKPIVVGPYTENFADSIAAFEAGSAIYILRPAPDDSAERIAEQLADAVRPLFGESGTAMGAAARRVVLDNQGVTERTVSALLDLVSHAKHRAS